MKYSKEYISELMDIIELLFSLDTRILSNKLMSKFFIKHELLQTRLSGGYYCLFEHQFNSHYYVSIYLDRNMWDTISIDNPSGDYIFHFHNPYRKEIERDIGMLKMAHKYLKRYHDEIR